MIFSDFDIDIGRKASGQIYVVCPKCSFDRRKKSNKCLSVNIDQGVWHCHHCGWKGSLHKKKYERPKWENNTVLSDDVVEFFNTRNISQDVLIKMKVTQTKTFMPQANEERACICFNYFRDGEFVNIKYRDAEKNFKMYKDAELVLYNLDGIKDQKIIYFVEGEMDCLTMLQLGFGNATSVPNGANKKSNNLEYLDNCWQYLENLEKVYLMTDNDDPGKNLADELARRIGVERCVRVDLSPYKDINEAYSKGEKINQEWIDSRSSDYPLVGIFNASSFWDDLINIKRNGFPKGWKPRAPFGNHVTIHPGYQTIITGIPGHGKGEFLDQVLIELGIDYDLRGAFFTPENKPTSMHLIKIVEKITGQNFWKLSEEQINAVKEWVEKHLYWIMPEDGFNLTNILNYVRQLVLKFGINWYVIDPWNKLDHQYTGSETSYISRALDEMELFNKKNNVHGFLVAHPSKMEKDKDGMFAVPNLYSISGSAHFFNKADVGFTVYKNAKGQSTVHVQKVKFKYWGSGVGAINYMWSEDSGRYYVADGSQITNTQDLSNWMDKPVVAPNEFFSKPQYDPSEARNKKDDDMPF